MIPRPSLTIQTLASGSSGNMALVRSARATVVLDMGLPSGRATQRALCDAGVEPDLVTAVLVSHAHTDHLHKAALAWFCKSGVPILAGLETTRQVQRLCGANGRARISDRLVPIGPGSTYLIEDIEVTPFSVPHDVPTYGFSFVARGGFGVRKVTIATDLGCAPDRILPHFADADAVLIEANYNEDLLENSPRHPVDKERVRSDRGHLSNHDAGEFLRRVVDASERPPSSVLLVHLSGDHNDPDLAIREVRIAMGRASCRIPYLATAPRRGPGPLIRV